MSTEVSRPLITGPTSTRRLGNVLTVDLTAPQTNLVVERGSNVPRASLIVTTAARRIIELSKEGEKLEHILVVGTGDDPTLHPDLREIAENLRALRTKWFQRAKLTLVSRVTDLDAYELRSAMGLFDKLVIDFEAGSAKSFTALTGSKGPGLTSFTKHLGAFEHLVVQARFVRGDIDNTTDTEVKGWIKRIDEIRPQEVHILTGVREIAGKKLKPATKGRYQQIADELIEKTGLSVSVHDDEALVA